MSKSAPGPWNVINGGIKNKDRMICHTTREFYYAGQDERYADEVKERIADAFLIAAAPDMLQVLLDIRASIRGSESKNNLAVRAVIKKALGEV